MTFQVHHLARTLALAALLAGTGVAAAQGLIYVLESTAATVKAGAAYNMADSLDVPSGASVRVVMPSGRTHTIKGPYSGLVSDLAKGEAPNDSVIAWLKNLLQTGGSNERTPGATRSMRAAPRAPQAFSWTAIPVDADGIICVQKGARLELQRSSRNTAEQATVIDEASARRGVAEFDVGKDAAPWPAEVAVRPDARYMVVVGSGAGRHLTLRVLDRLPTETDILKELATRGCRSQFNAWVRDRSGKTTAR